MKKPVSEELKVQQAKNREAMSQRMKFSVEALCDAADNDVGQRFTITWGKPIGDLSDADGVALGQVLNRIAALSKYCEFRSQHFKRISSGPGHFDVFYDDTTPPERGLESVRKNAAAMRGDTA